MKTKHHEIGLLGEKIARKYLEKRGYQTIEQNYRTRYAEIDLILWYEKSLVFVEVRTKVGERFGAPEESIKGDKIHRLKRAAAVYFSQKGYNRSYRIDAVCIVLSERQRIQRVSHYQNITLI